MARIFHKFKSKIGLSIFALCLTFCLIGSSVGMLTAPQSVRAEEQPPAPPQDTETVDTSASGEVYNFAYTGGIQSKSLTAGIYKLEVWGAEGAAGYDQGTPGKGGYSVGLIQITTTTTVYVVVGGTGRTSAGTCTSTDKSKIVAGYNGGGAGNGNDGAWGGAGGGATHIARRTGVLKDLSSYQSDVYIVAGGGGGGGHKNQTGYLGGAGGGTSGIAGGAGTAVGTQSSGYAFGQGGSTSAHDQGAGGGGWWGGVGSSTNDKGGSGGSGYIGGVISNSTYGVTKNTIAGNASMPATGGGTETGHAGDGYARITSLNSPPSNKTEPNTTKTRGTNTTHLLRDIAQDVDTPTKNDTFMFADQNIYLASNNAVATDYLKYSFANAGNNNTNTSAAPSFTYSPKKWFAATRFYVKVKDNNGAVGNVYFTLTVSDQGIEYKSGSGAAYESTLSGSTYTKGAAISPVAYRAATADDVAKYNTTGQVVSGVRTLFIGKSVSRGSDGNPQRVMVRIEDLVADKDTGTNGSTKDNVLIKAAQKHNTSDTTYDIKLQADTYGTAGSYYDCLVIESKPGTTNQGQYSSIIVTYVAKENGGSAHITQNDATYQLRIVFKVDNTRPVLQTGKLVQVKAGESVRFNLASFLSDLDGNDLLFTSSGKDAVKIPQYEFIQVNKYGELVNSAGSTHYNKSKTGTPVTQDYVTQYKDYILQNGYHNNASMETGFKDDLIVLNTEYNGGKETYATYEITADRREIIITGRHATRTQYQTSRGTSLGHFYILVHVEDSGEVEDTGIWMPIAIEVTNTAPVAATGGETNYTLEVGESKYFSPIGGYGCWDMSNPTASAAESFTFASDVDEFAEAGTTARNSFLYFMSGTRTGSDSGFNELPGGGLSNYIGLERVPLYAPKETVAKLTASEKTKLNLSEVTGTDWVRFDGLKITGKASTLQNYLELTLTVADSMDLAGDEPINQTLAFCVTNRNLAARTDKVGGEGELKTDTDGNPYIHYEIYNSVSIALTPYDFVTDPDTAETVSPEESSQKFDVQNRPLYSDKAHRLYATPNSVKVRGQDGTKALGYDTLRFVFAGNEIENAFGYNNYLTVSENTGSDGIFPHIKITSKVRTTFGAPIKFTLTIADSSTVSGVPDHTVTVNIVIDVKNRLPELQEGNDLFYISADSGNGTVPDANADPLHYYNILEYTVGELATDKDAGDNNNLAFANTDVKVFTLDENKAEIVLTGYVEAAILESGSGGRIGRQVLYIKALSSTQALPRGLFVAFNVTDGFDRVNADVSQSRLVIQIEVMNSRPVMADGTKFEKTEDGYVWDISPQNPLLKADRNSTRYIAGSESVYRYLLANDTAVAHKGSDKEHTTMLAADYDGRQHLLLATNDHYDSLPTVQPLTTEGFGGTTGSAAVLYSAVYGADTDTKLDIQLLYFTETNGQIALFTGTDEEKLNKLKNDELLWAIAVTPKDEFKEKHLELQIQVRDNMAEGGDTLGQVEAYSGKRADGKTAITSRTVLSVKMLLPVEGFVNNIIAYESGDGVNDGDYFVYDANNPSAPYWYPVEAERFSYLKTVEVKKSGVTYLPISYLALPQSLAPTENSEHKTKDVSFATNHNINLVDLTQDVTLSDGVTTWSGTDLMNNPYLTINAMQDSGSDKNFENSPYRNRHLYYFASADADTPTAVTGYVYENTLGLTLQKKSIRSSGELTMSVRLAQYNNDGSKDFKDGMPIEQEVRFKLTVENDFLDIKKIRTSKHDYDATPKTVDLMKNDGSVGVLEQDVTLMSSDLTLRLACAGNETPKENTLLLLYATDKDYANSGVYSESAYFLSRSVSDQLTAADVARMLARVDESTAGLANTNETEADVLAYLGLSAWQKEVDDATLAGINAKLNPGYQEFFTVIPGNTDSTSLTLRPKRKTDLNLTGKDAAEKQAILDKYHLQEKIVGGKSYGYYYPLRTVVYDDYRGTGWENSAYQLVQINVFIRNTAPTVTAGDPGVDGKVYALSIEKGKTLTLDLTSVLSDADMIINSRTHDFEMAKDITDDLDKISRDWLPASAEYTESNGTKHVVKNGIELLSGTMSDKVTINIDTYSKITFEAKERLGKNETVSYAMYFYDSTMARSEKLTFRISVSNQSPTIFRIGTTPITNVLTGAITLQADDYFTVFSTSWENFISGAWKPTSTGETLTEAQLKDRVTADKENKLPMTYGLYFSTGSGGSQGDHRNLWLPYDKLTYDAVQPWLTQPVDGADYGLRTYRSAAGVGDNDKNRGYLPLADDDTPWGLRLAGYTVPTLSKGAFDIEVQDILPRDDTVQRPEQGQEYCLAYKITARNACQNVSLRFRLTDGEGLFVDAIIRVTVVSSKPEMRLYDREQTYEADTGNPWTLQSGDQSAKEFFMTMYQGDTARVEADYLATDADTNETLRLRSGTGGRIFTIDNVATNANKYISLSAYGTYFTVTALNVNDTGSSGYSDVKFTIEDGSNLPDNKVDLICHIRVLPRAITASPALQKVAVQSVRDYVKESVPEAFSLFTGRDNDESAAFTDPDCAAETVRYTLELYALCDKDGLGLELTDDKKAAQKVADYTVNGLQFADTEVAAYVQTYFTLNVIDGGRTLTFVPKRSTRACEGGSVPLRVQVTKQFTYGSESVLESVQKADYRISVDNSPLEAVGNTTLNYGHLQDGNRFLTYDAHVGETFAYEITGSVREDFGLFKDVDIRKEDGEDVGDAVTVRDADITVIDSFVVDADTILSTTPGWDADAAKGLARVFTASIKDGKITFKINRKLVPEEKDEPGILLIKIVGRDMAGTTAETVLTIRIRNTAPVFQECVKENYTSEYGNLGSGVDGSDVMGFALDLKIGAGETKEIALEDIITDPDLVDGNYATERFDFLPVRGAEPSSIAGISGKPDAVHTVTDSEGGTLFSVRVSDVNNTKLLITCVSTLRDAEGEIWLHVEDSSHMQTPEPMRIRIKVTNSAPFVKDDAQTLQQLVGLQTGTSAKKSYSIIDFIGDANINDLATDGDSTTYVRITGIELVPVDEYIEDNGVSDEADANSGNIVECRIEPDDKRNQNFFIRPISGRYGSQTIRIYVTDDGNNNLLDSVSATLTLTVQVARDPSTVVLNNLDKLAWKTTSGEITPKFLLTDPATGKDYSLGYEIADMKLDAADEHKVGLIAEEIDGVKHWYATAEDLNAKKVPVYVYFKIAGVLQEKPMIFTVSVVENLPPEWKADFATERLILKSAMQDGYTVPFTVEDMFHDVEGDPITIRAAQSSQNMICEASVVDNVLILTWKARGSVTVTMTITDLTGRDYVRTFSIQNPDLPKVNFFQSIVISIQENPVLYICIAAGVLLLIILLLIIIGVVRHKKHVQAEVEALLVSEMQLEEQMMKLSAAQNAYNPYAALPPTSQPADPGLMLGSTTPPQNQTIGLNAPPPQSFDDFDDSDF